MEDDDFTDSYVPENENDLHNDDDSEEEFQKYAEDENDEYFSLDKDQVKVEAQDSDSDEPLKPKSKRGPGRPRKIAKNVLHRPKRNYVKSGKPRKYAKLKIKKVKIGSNFFPIFFRFRKSVSKVSSSKPSEASVETKCRHCDKDFPSKNRAYVHEREVHLAGKCYCPSCFLPFNTTYDLIDHMDAEHPEMDKNGVQLLL